MKIKRWVKWFIGDWWVVRKTIWPYSEGYGTYNKLRKMVLDTGLSKEMAKQNCKKLNDL